LTPQYAGLQELWAKYSGKGLTVVGFPCNQFNGQEPGTPAEIAAFCREKYSVTFPLMEKVEVQEGPGQSPVYAWLQARTGKVPEWNFSKFLVSRDGTSVQYFGPRIAPDASALIAAIEAALGQRAPPG
jgi:glutathione peroxidase